MTLSSRTSPFDLFPRETPPADRSSERRVLTIGISMWIVAALSLVAGIVVGFSSGYTAGRRAATTAAPADASADRDPAAATAGRGEAPGTFTEGTVSEPVRVDAEPIVPAPEPASPPAAKPAPPARTTRAPSDSATAPPSPRAPADSAPAPPSTAAAPGDASAPPRDARARGDAAAPPAAAGTGPGSLQVLSRPAGARVVVDGQLIGQTPLLLSNVQAGAHEVRIELDGFRLWSTSVEVRPGTRARVAASLEQ